MYKLKKDVNLAHGTFELLLGSNATKKSAGIKDTRLEPNEICPWEISIVRELDKTLCDWHNNGFVVRLAAVGTLPPPFCEPTVANSPPIYRAADLCFLQYLIFLAEANLMMHDK